MLRCEVRQTLYTNFENLLTVQSQIVYNNVGEYIMTTKICCSCKKKLPLESFCKNKTKADGRGTKCKECQKQYLKDHYKKNKKYYADKAEKARKANAQWWKEYKSTLECKECGENHPACLQFHHKDKNKEDTVSNLVYRGSKEKLFKEISKCDVLCANCHAKIHWNE